MATADTRHFKVDTKGRLKTIAKQLEDFDKIKPEKKETIEIPKFIQDFAIQTQIYITIFCSGIIFGFAVANMIRSMSH